MSYHVTEFGKELRIRLIDCGAVVSLASVVTMVIRIRKPAKIGGSDRPIIERDLLPLNPPGTDGIAVYTIADGDLEEDRFGTYDYQGRFEFATQVLYSESYCLDTRGVIPAGVTLP